MKTYFTIAMLLVCCHCYAEIYQIGPMPSSVPIADTMSAQKARELRWQTEKWTGSDAPFIQTSDRIEASLRQGTSLEEMLNEAEAMAVKKPYESTAQYAWCYLAYKSVKVVKFPDAVGKKFNRLRQRLGNSTQGMIFGTQPHSYIYSRLLFLARREEGGSEYAMIGHRLIARNSEDDEIRRTLIRMDTDSFYPPKTQEALDYARYLYRKSPDDADLYFMIGNIYYGEFLTHKQSQVADQAIANWHKSFQRSAPSKQALAYIQDNMKWIRHVESKQPH